MGDSPLAEWRKRAALSQSQLAQLLGVHRSTISCVERGGSLGRHVYQRLAERYGLPLEMLLGRQLAFMERMKAEADKKLREVVRG